MHSKYPGIKKTIVSVGAVVSTAATVSASIEYVSTPVTLDSNGDSWYLDGVTADSLCGMFSTSVTSSSFRLRTVTHGASVATLEFDNDWHDIPIPPSSTYSEGGYVKKFSADDLIYQNGTSYLTSNNLTLQTYRVSPTWSGGFGNFKNFTSGQDSYVAFSYQYNNGSDWSTQYGWALINFDLVGPDYSMIIKEWAYTTAGENILVGQILGSVPEPAETAGGLGLLVLGAAGMRRYLQNRRQKAS